MPGKENQIADILSRWAYPASQALRYVSKHGSLEDKEEMEEIIQKEREEEMGCLIIRLKGEPDERNAFIRGITTRSGKKTEGEDRSRRGTEGGVTPKE